MTDEQSYKETIGQLHKRAVSAENRLVSIERQIQEICDQDLIRGWTMTSEDIGRVRVKLLSLISSTH